MTSATIDIENFIHFEVKEEEKISKPIIHTSIFLGQAQDPIYSAEISFDDFLKEYIDSNTIPGTPEHKLKDEYYQLLMKGLESMTESIEKAKKRIEKMPYWDAPEKIVKKSKKKK